MARLFRGESLQGQGPGKAIAASLSCGAAYRVKLRHIMRNVRGRLSVVV
jgi:hypothetical protein